jgi:hypothetical protein
MQNLKGETKMRIRYFLIAGLLASAAIYAASPKSNASADGPAAYARLKTLAGEWEADSDQGKAHLNLELIAGGTALVERETAEKMPAMETVYHLDGPRLLLTHYCMAGNQPRLEAASFNQEKGELQFRFLDVTNLATPGAGHMHDVLIRFVDNNHFETEWQFFENGKPKFTEKALYTRIR